MSAIDLWTWGARYGAIVHALRETGGTFQRAARLLGLSRNTLYLWLRELR